MPDFDPIEALLTRIRGRSGRRPGAWPPESERATWRTVLEWRAFLDSERDELARIAEWDRSSGRKYKVDPLAERIADAWADHLFSEDLDVAPANEGDVDLLDELVDENELTELCRGAERDHVASEGEGWWRWTVDEEVSPVPILEWHSRASVAPYYVGGRLVASALIFELEGRANVETAANSVFRHFECHAEGEVRNVLFRGTKDKLGTEVDLDAHPETEELDDQWDHGLPMLMGRVINKRARNPRLGRSEFHSVRDFLLELNEALTIGGENMRLTAKKRVVVSSESLAATQPALPTGDELVDVGDGSMVRRDGRPQFAAGEDVLVADPLNEELGKDTPAPFKVLEYSFDAAALIAHKRDLVETAVTRLGLTPQWLGIVADAGDGLALSGTALRLRLIPTTKAGHGKGKQWDRALPRILRAGALLSELPPEAGGLGLDWTAADELPSVQRAEPLPSDEVEEATIESTLVNAGVRSLTTSIRAQHPEWNDEQVAEERAAILEDRKTAPAAGGLLA